MEKAVWLFDTLQSVKAHVISSVIPRNALETDTSSTHFSCFLTAPLCLIVCNPPCSYLIGRKASYVTLIDSIFLMLNEALYISVDVVFHSVFVCLSILTVAAFTTSIWWDVQNRLPPLVFDLDPIWSEIVWYEGGKEEVSPCLEPSLK